jgi:galactose-1-phosphate uridylyltransferase
MALERGGAMSGFYRFPAMAKLGEFTNEEQAEKVWDEATEAFNALLDSLWDYDTGTRREEMSDSDRTAYGMELMDVIHAAETALRIEFSDEEVESLKDAVIVKNYNRRYYREDVRFYVINRYLAQLNKD